MFGFSSFFFSRTKAVAPDDENKSQITTRRRFYGSLLHRLFDLKFLFRWRPPLRCSPLDI